MRVSEGKEETEKKKNEKNEGETRQRRRGKDIGEESVHEGETNGKERERRKKAERGKAMR